MYPPTKIEMQMMDAIIAMNRKMDDQRTPNWEQRRYEIAARVMANLCDQPMNCVGGTVKSNAEKAVNAADALIAELKKKENNEVSHES